MLDFWQFWFLLMYGSIKPRNDQRISMQCETMEMQITPYFPLFFHSSSHFTYSLSSPAVAHCDGIAYWYDFWSLFWSIWKMYRSLTYRTYRTYRTYSNPLCRPPGQAVVAWLRTAQGGRVRNIYRTPPALFSVTVTQSIVLIGIA